MLSNSIDHEKLRDALNAEIKAARERRFAKTHDWVAISKLSRRTVYNLENGGATTSAATLATLWAACEELGVRPSTLIRRVERRMGAGGQG